MGPDLILSFLHYSSVTEVKHFEIIFFQPFYNGVTDSSNQKRSLLDLPNALASYFCS